VAGKGPVTMQASGTGHLSLADRAKQVQIVELDADERLSIDGNDVRDVVRSGVEDPSGRAQASRRTVGPSTRTTPRRTRSGGRTLRPGAGGQLQSIVAQMT
jgi:hypothetical protein